MSHMTNEFAALAERVQRGESDAGPALQRMLEGALGPMVRRALRGQGTSLLDQRIREAARRASHGEKPPAGLAALVGASLSARLVGGMRAGADSVSVGRETVIA